VLLLQDADQAFQLGAAALVDHDGGGEVAQEPGRVDLDRLEVLLGQKRVDDQVAAL
jgi:hypothetical protein